MNRSLFHTRARERGAIIPIVALLMPVLLVMTAFAVDLGRQRADRRNMQAVADVIALDMSRLANGRTIDEINLGDPYGHPAPASVALTESAARNGVDVSQLTLTWGTYDPLAETFTPLIAGTDEPDAAHIRAVDNTDYYFQPGSGDVSREAVAQLGRTQRAEFVLGSTLVEVDPAQGWFLGQVVSFIIPGADLVGYDGLANAEITLADLAVALGVGSVEDLLDLEVTFEELLLAMAYGLSQQGNTIGLAVIDELLALDVQELDVRIGDLLGLDTTEPDAGLIGEVSVPQLLSLAAILAGGNNFIRVPPSVINLAGLGTVDLAVHVVEGPIRVGIDDGASGTTKQVGVTVVAGLGIEGTGPVNLCGIPRSERGVLRGLISGLLGGLSCLVGAIIERTVNAQIDGTIKLDMTVAGVTATQVIRCEADQLTVNYLGSPLTVKTDVDLEATVTLAGAEIDLLDVHVPAVATASQGMNGSVTFDVLDDGPVHVDFAEVATGLPTAAVGAPTLGLTNLLRIYGLDVRVLGAELPVIGELVEGLVEPMLNDILDGLDTILISQISRLLGLNLGGADITPQWLDCDDDGSALLVR